MKVLAKILRRGIVLWCGYGLVKLAIIVNPFVAYFGRSIITLLGGEDVDPKDYNACGWLLLIVGLFVLIFLYFIIQKVSAWLFNES